MTISTRVQQQFFAPDPVHQRQPELIRLPPTVMAQYDALDAMGSDIAIKKTRASSRSSTAKRRTNLWTVDEHERFLRGLAQYPQGPWKEVAAVVGTKTARQTMTHAQKYRQKIGRRMRGERSHKELLDLQSSAACSSSCVYRTNPAAAADVYADFKGQHQHAQHVNRHQDEALRQQRLQPVMSHELMLLQGHAQIMCSPIDTSYAVFDAELDHILFTPQGIDEVLEMLMTEEV